ncbi:uncharacterized protein LOC102808720 [Saccoglossus kowalevskii]
MMLAVPTDESAYNDIVNAIKAMGELDTEYIYFGIRKIDGDIKTIYGSRDFYRAFAPNAPNGNSDNCVAISVKQDYKYVDVDCGSKARTGPEAMFVCEPLDPYYATELVKYKIFDTRTSRDDSIRNCKNRGMVLATDPNEMTHAALMIKIWITVSLKENYHIDAVKGGSTGVVSSTGRSQNFKPFAKGEVDGQGNCFYLRRTKEHQWGDQKCSRGFGYICYDRYATSD